MLDVRSHRVKIQKKNIKYETEASRSVRKKKKTEEKNRRNYTTDNE